MTARFRTYSLITITPIDCPTFHYQAYTRRVGLFAAKTEMLCCTGLTHACVLAYKDLKIIISVKDGEKHNLIPKVPYSEPVNARVPQITIRFGTVVREMLEQHESCTIVWSKMHKLRHKPSVLPESLSDDMLKIKSVPALTDKDIRISADMGMVRLLC